jgi:hypothetical protein
MNQDTIHYLFPNLNKLLNFQRKFLIRLESTAELPWPDQRWGLHFIENVRALFFRSHLLSLIWGSRCLCHCSSCIPSTALLVEHGSGTKGGRIYRLRAVLCQLHRRYGTYAG